MDSQIVYFACSIEFIVALMYAAFPRRLDTDSCFPGHESVQHRKRVIRVLDEDRN